MWARTAALPFAMTCDGEQVTVRGRYVLAVDDGNAYLEAGSPGWAFCGCPTTAGAHRARGELVPLFEQWQLEPMPMYVAFPPNRHVSAKLRVFIEWVAELMAQHAPVANRRRGAGRSRDTRTNAAT